VFVGSVGPLGPLHFWTIVEHPVVASGILLSGHNFGHPSAAGSEPSAHLGTILAHPSGVGFEPSGQDEGHPYLGSEPSKHFLNAGVHPATPGAVPSGQTWGHPLANTVEPSGHLGWLASVGQL